MFFSTKNRKAAFHRATKLRKRPCSKCGLYGCICQIGLPQFMEKPRPKFMKTKCENCKTYLCDCPKDAHGDRIEHLEK